MADDDGRRPFAEVLPSLGIHPLPEGATVVEAFVVVKFLDGEGGPVYAYRTTSRPNREELLGVLRVQAALLEKELVAEWE